MFSVRLWKDTMHPSWLWEVMATEPSKGIRAEMFYKIMKGDSTKLAASDPKMVYIIVLKC